MCILISLALEQGRYHAFTAVAMSFIVCVFSSGIVLIFINLELEYLVLTAWNDKILVILIQIYGLQINEI